MDDVMAMIMSEEETSGPPLFEMVAMWSPMGGDDGLGRMGFAWRSVHGIAFLPDLKGDFQPHAAHGMVANLTVTNHFGSEGRLMDTTAGHSLNEHVVGRLFGHIVCVVYFKSVAQFPAHGCLPSMGWLRFAVCSTSS